MSDFVHHTSQQPKHAIKSSFTRCIIACAPDQNLSSPMSRLSFSSYPETSHAQTFPTPFHPPALHLHQPSGPRKHVHRPIESDNRHLGRQLTHHRSASLAVEQACTTQYHTLRLDLHASLNLHQNHTSLAPCVANADLIGSTNAPSIAIQRLLALPTPVGFARHLVNSDDVFLATESRTSSFQIGDGRSRYRMVALL